MKQFICLLYFFYTLMTYSQTRVVFECNFDNAIITNSCFVGSNMYMIVSKGIGKADKKAPIAPLSDVTSSLKYTSNGQKCKIPYQVKPFSWNMFFCNDGYCPTQMNQNVACLPGQFGYFEFRANGYKVTFPLNTPASGINGVNTQCLIYYYYMTNTPGMMDKITVRKLETVIGSSTIDTVINGSINGWNERRVSFSTSKTGYKIYFDLERISGPLLEQSYVAIDEISIHQETCSRVTTTIATTTTKTTLRTSTSSFTTSSVTTTTTTKTQLATSTSETSTITTNERSTTISSAIPPNDTTTIRETSSTTLHSVELTFSDTSATFTSSTTTTTETSTNISVFTQTTEPTETILLTTTTFSTTPSETILTDSISTVPLILTIPTVIPTIPRTSSIITSTLLADTTTTTSVSTASLVSSSVSTATVLSTASTTLSKTSSVITSTVPVISSTEQMTMTTRARTTTIPQTTKITTLAGKVNVNDSSNKTVIIVLATSIPGVLILVAVSVIIWMKTSVSTLGGGGGGVLGSSAHPFSNIVEHSESSALVELDELKNKYRF